MNYYKMIKEATVYIDGAFEKGIPKPLIKNKVKNTWGLGAKFVDNREIELQEIREAQECMAMPKKLDEKEQAEIDLIFNAKPS